MRAYSEVLTREASTALAFATIILWLAFLAPVVPG
jgi:hypothetical protein